MNVFFHFLLLIAISFLCGRATGKCRCRCNKRSSSCRPRRHHSRPPLLLLLLLPPAAPRPRHRRSRWLKQWTSSDKPNESSPTSESAPTASSKRSSSRRRSLTKATSLSKSSSKKTHACVSIFKTFGRLVSVPFHSLLLFFRFRGLGFWIGLCDVVCVISSAWFWFNR